MSERHFISYPKSGRTWLRYVLLQLELDEAIVFHHDGFEFNDPAKPTHDFDVLARRARYSSVSKIIYLRRDPRDVMVSLFHQVTGRFRDFFQYRGSLSDFIRDDYFGAMVLARFRTIWEELASGDPRVLVVDYEDCHRDLPTVIAGMAAHLGLPASPEAIEAAAANASFERMKEVEDSGAFAQPWLRRRNDAPKVRAGVAGGYRSALDAADIDYLDRVFGLGNPRP